MARYLLITSMVCALSSYCANAQEPSASDCLASGQQGGRYQAFADRLLELAPDPDICIAETAGTIENLQGLESGRFAFAIAQGDLTMNMFNGENGFSRWRDFAVVAPLFPEYIQALVRRDETDILLLGDLRGRTVNVGVSGSGGYINALDILSAAGLREGVDYLPSNLSTSEALRALSDGLVDAVFITAAEGYEFDNRAYRQMPMPPGILTDLASTNSHYEVGTLNLDGDSATALAVRAFLLSRNDTPVGDVRALTATLLDNWDTFEDDFYGLHEPRDFLFRTPFPFHDASRSELVIRGYANPPPAYALWITIWAAISLSSLIAVTFETTYDRTGAKRERRGRFSFVQTLIDLWAKPSPWVLGISLFVMTLLIALVGIRLAEAAHARNYNLDNPFADLTLSEGFIWMLTFVASGFTENNAYPLSIIGRILVAVLAFIGVSGPIAAIFVVVNLWGKRRAERFAGLLKIGWKNHVLVCGWNENLDGVIYALTGNDTESKKKVSIVAQSGDATPLQGRKFDQAKVSFRQGDSANREVLKSVNAEHASHAIILADFDRRSTQNIGSILTAMNLKRLNPKIRISAELAFGQNADHFVAFGCSTIITPDIFIAKAAALCTIHPLMIDFILEILTYDEFDEIYSIEFEQLCNLNSTISMGMKVEEIEKIIWMCGANLVGIVRGDIKRDAIFDAQITDGGSILTLTRQSGYSYKPILGDRILYSANRRGAIKSIKNYRSVIDSKPIERNKFNIKKTQRKNILIYASCIHIERLKKNLKTFHSNSVVHAITIEEYPFLTEKILDDIVPSNIAFDHIIVLADADRKMRADSNSAIRAIDAGTLLATNLLSEHASQNGWNSEIVSEVLAREDREAFTGSQQRNQPNLESPGEKENCANNGAGASAIVPSATLVERFLVKDVFDGNAVLDFLIGVMNMRDGTHLYIHEVSDADELIGETYASLVRTRIPGLHLVGWLPISKRNELRNRAKDFTYHFRTTYDKRIEQKAIQKGDLIVFTVCFSVWNGETQAAK
jgi:TRAP transporter TAXI family solute receptor